MDVVLIKARLLQSIDEAIEHPEEANIPYLCDVLTIATQPLDPSDSLWVAGDVLGQIVEVFHQRSQRLFETLEAHPGHDPVVPPDLFQDLVRQSGEVDLSELIERSSTPIRRPYSAFDSIVFSIDRDVFLNNGVEDVPASSPQTLDEVRQLASDEDVTRWITVIQQALPSQPIRLLDLYHQTTLSFVELWLGLLLGGFQINRDDTQFYTSEYWIGR